MCGIFAYTGHEPLSILEVLKVLQILELEQERPSETSPLGGDGAGVAFLDERGKFIVEKVGKTKESPVYDLRLLLGKTAPSSCLILGHVRQASPEFQKTIEHKECTQPYKPLCPYNFNLVSAHNGVVQNYLDLKDKLNTSHSFESQKVKKIIDSEVIPHLFEELLSKSREPRKATHALFEQIEGSNTHGNTAILIFANKGVAHLNVIHKGKTRGLIIWTSPKNEVLLCSREQPVEKILNKFVRENNFKKIVEISHKDSVDLEAHFSLNLLEPQK